MLRNDEVKRVFRLVELNKLRKPNPEIVEMWENFSKVAEQILSQIGSDLRIVCGYHISDMIISINRAPVLSQREFIRFNLYSLQFFVDFISYSAKPSKETFLHFYSKYMEDYMDDDSPEHQAWCSFFGYQRSKGKDEYSFKVFMLASMGMFYSLIHELFHRESELRNSALRLIESDAFRSVKNTKTLNTDQKDEIACDFCALNILMSLFDMSEYQLTREQIVTCAVLATYVNELYSMLRSVDLLNTESSTVALNTAFERLMLIVHSRFMPLMSMTKISQNTKWEWFSGINLAAVIDEVNERITSFCNDMGQFCLGLEVLCEEYNSLNDTDKPEANSSRIADYQKMWIWHNLD